MKHSWNNFMCDSNSERDKQRKFSCVSSQGKGAASKSGQYISKKCIKI